jgi:hypothetical protein
MRRFYLSATIAFVSAWACETGYAGVIAMPPPGPARAANSDAVIVGKVEALEPQDVTVGNTKYRIAVVRINEGIKGAKAGQKALRIGFVPIEKPNPIVIRTGARPVQLEPGQEGLFLLKKQAKEDFYTIGGVVGYFINSDKNKDFDKEVQAAKTAAKAAANPQASLKAKEAEERLLAAAILIERYRAFRGPNAKQEAIDAEESKQILQALVGAEWQTPLNFGSLRPNPTQLFQMLGVTAKDGFVLPKGSNYQDAARMWLARNVDTYRIQRFTAGQAK